MNFEKISTWSSVASSLAAAVALMWNVYIFNDAVERQESSAAMGLYGEYMKLAMENPKFIFEEQDITKLSPNEGMKYTIFATSALNVSERLYLASRSDASWRKVAESIIANHHDFLILNFECNDFNPKFRDFLVKKVPGFKCK